jgi:hypothetical protein
MGQTAWASTRAHNLTGRATWQRSWFQRARAIIASAIVISTALYLSEASSQTLPSEISGNPNEVLTFGEMKVPRWLAESVVRAAQVTNVDPVYLMALADKESSFLPESKARTSSATGLFQFIDATWLAMIHRYGPKYGYATEAEAITFVRGRPTVPDSKDRERILGLRSVPYLAALMVGEMITTQRDILARDPSFGELYLAHFLGMHGARRFVELLSTKPVTSAPRAFPSAARANRALFFVPVRTKAGRLRLRPMTLAEVRERIEAIIDRRVTRYAKLRLEVLPEELASSEPRMLSGHFGDLGTFGTPLL